MTATMRDLLVAAGAALWAAAAMTLGDWIWAVLALPHRPQYGLAHGALLCLWLGAYLGLLAGRTAHGAAVGAVVGLVAAGSFYALAPWLGYPAMFASWVLLWFGMAALAGRLLQPRHTAGGDLLRALAAAAGAGVAFYAVSDIWLRPSPARGYLWHFAAWTVAFLPGTLALLLGRATGPVSRAS